MRAFRPHAPVLPPTRSSATDPSAGRPVARGRISGFMRLVKTAGRARPPGRTGAVGTGLRVRLLQRRVVPGLVAGAMGLFGCTAGEGGPTFLSIGTGGTGGVYYPLGGALASRLSLSAEDRRVTAEVTGGSVENVNRLRTGQLDLGFVLSVTAWEAYRGEGDFEDAFEDLRIVAPLYANMTHVLVREAAGIEGVGDLRGRRVSVGSPGSGTEQVARQLLEAWDLDYDDVDERFLSFSESAGALRDGALDAAVLSVGYPAGAVLEALTAGGIALLPLGEDVVERLRVRHPYYRAGAIPPGVYPGLAEPVPTTAMMNWIVARADLDPAVVADLLNILGPERVSLEESHQMAGQIDMAAIEEAPIPLHATTAERMVR